MTSGPAYAYVALLDVIGYKAYLERDKKEGTLEFANQLQRSFSKLGSINEVQFQYQAISDTVIFSCGQKELFFDLLLNLKKLYLSFLSEGLLIRGGIAYGHHFKSSNVTYSHALSNAYHLENTVAIYPRIVIDENIILIQKELSIDVNRSLIAESNGIIFLDIIDNDNVDEVYGLAKSIYERDKDSIFRCDKELQKHIWLQSYITHHPASLSKSFCQYIEGMSLY